jgi:hypothetical protein
MFPAISVIAILIFSILITRIAAAALENTGLSGDNLIIYGSQTSIQKLDVREKGRKGNLDHEKAKAIQEEVKKKQKQEDEG